MTIFYTARETSIFYGRKNTSASVLMMDGAGHMSEVLA